RLLDIRLRELDLEIVLGVDHLLDRDLAPKFIGQFLGKLDTELVIVVVFVRHVSSYFGLDTLVTLSAAPFLRCFSARAACLTAALPISSGVALNAFAIASFASFIGFGGGVCARVICAVNLSRCFFAPTPIPRRLSSAFSFSCGE